MKILKRILLVLALIVIIAGIVMISLKGFNYGLLYSKTQRMNIYIDKEFNIEDIEQIAKEELGDNVSVRVGNFFGTVASVISKEISEEQQNNIINKINEKYGTEIKKDEDTAIMNVPQAKIFDIISNYIAPAITISVISLVYLAVRFKEQGVINSLIKPLISVILVIALYVSIFAIARIPINDLFIVFATLLFILTFIINTIKLNQAEN